jgi:hypothetical protein
MCPMNFKLKIKDSRSGDTKQLTTGHGQLTNKTDNGQLTIDHHKQLTACRARLPKILSRQTAGASLQERPASMLLRDRFRTVSRLLRDCFESSGASGRGQAASKVRFTRAF